MHTTNHREHMEKAKKFNQLRILFGEQMMKKGGFFDPFFMFRPFVNLANKRKGKGPIKRKSRLIIRR